MTDDSDRKALHVLKARHGTGSISITDHGHWDGDVFHFDYPIELTPGQVMQKMDFSSMDLPDEMSRDEIIESFLDPKRTIEAVEDFCACGKPLHYSDTLIEANMHELVAELGPDIVVSAGGKSYSVPRHYIALHGLVADEIERYGFPLA